MKERVLAIARYATHPLALVLSGALLGSSTVFPYVFLLAPLALMPFFALLHENVSLRVLAGRAYFFGIGFFGVTYAWVWGTYPLTWIGVEHKALSFMLIALAWLITIAVLAITMSMRAVFATWLTRSHHVLFPYSIASVWILFEAAQAFLFSLVWSGSQGLIGAHWTFGFLGFALAEVPVVRSLAALGGVYLLSFFAVFLSAVVYQWYVHKKVHAYTHILLGIFFIAALSAFFISIHIPNVSMQKVFLAHTQFRVPVADITREDVEGRSVRIAEVIREHIAEGTYPDIVLFPEGSAILNYLPETEADRLFSELTMHRNTLIVNPSNSVGRSDELTSSIWYVHARSGIIEEQKKDLLAPVGEYAPYSAQFVARLFGVTPFFETIYETHGYHRASGYTRTPDVAVGVLQCSEIVSPALYRELAKEHTILANSASYGPFQTPFLIRQQTLKMARVHATAHDRFFLQSGNIAPAFVITPTGTVQAYTYGNEEILVAEVVERATRTPYTQLGEWVLLVAALFVVMTLWYQHRKAPFLYTRLLPIKKRK